MPIAGPRSIGFFLSYLGNMTIFKKIWQFAKIVIFLYDNLNMTIFLRILKIWQYTIWQYLKKICNIWQFTKSQIWKIIFFFHHLNGYSFAFLWIKFISFSKKLNCHFSVYDNRNMTINFEYFSNMTICDMTIIFIFPKYDYLQYDNNFKIIVILEN